MFQNVGVVRANSPGLLHEATGSRFQSKSTAIKTYFFQGIFGQDFGDNIPSPVITPLRPLNAKSPWPRSLTNPINEQNKLSPTYHEKIKMFLQLFFTSKHKTIHVLPGRTTRTRYGTPNANESVLGT